MSSISAPTGAALPAVAIGQIDPRLQAAVAQLPADQQGAVIAKLKTMSPAQQQALIAQVTQAAQAQAGAGAPATAATPGTDQAAAGAVAATPPNKMATILKRVALLGGVGAAVGFGASFFTLPIVGVVTGPIAAAVGGGIGALAGLALGMREASKEQATFEQQQAAAAPVMPPVVAGPMPSGPAAPGMQAEPIGAPMAAGDAGARRASYTVVRGDSLSVIAARFDLTWQELYKANRSAVGSNPHMIHPGLKLRIPA